MPFKVDRTFPVLPSLRGVARSTCTIEIPTSSMDTSPFDSPRFFRSSQHTELVLRPPIVRIAPWHVSFATLDAPSKVYAQGSAALDKSPFYKAFYVQGTESLFRLAPHYISLYNSRLTSREALRTGLFTHRNDDSCPNLSRTKASKVSSPSCANLWVASFRG